MKSAVSASFVALTAISLSAPWAHAELALNFQPSATPLTVLITCMPGVAYFASSCVRKNSFADPDTTPFFMETVVDGGLGLYHVMIGDPSSDFSQEYYIAFSGGLNWYTSEFRMNASAGTFNGGADAAHNGTVTYYDPLSSNPLESGNATGRPDRTLFRQVVKGTDFNQVALKDRYLYQPMITQQLSNAQITSTWSIDSRANLYSAMSPTPGSLVNTLLVTDPQSGLIVTDFDIATDSQTSYVSGGRLLYTVGTGQGGSNGSYTYATGTFDARLIDWKALSDMFNVP